MFDFIKRKKAPETNKVEPNFSSDIQIVEFGNTSEKNTRAGTTISPNYANGMNNPSSAKIEGYMTTSELVNSCVRFIAEVAAQATPKIYKIADNGDSIPITDPKLKMWAVMPNPYFSWNELIQLVIQGMLLGGNGYLTFEVVKGQLESWFLVGSQVDVVPDPKKFLTGYIYNDEIPYKPSEIIHFKTPSLNNVYYGVSPVASLLDTLELEAYAIEELKEMYERGVLLKGVLESEFPLSDDQISALREQFNNLYSKQGGYRNGVAVLPNNLKFKSISMTAKESALLDSLNASEERVLQVFKMNKLVLGGMDTGGTHLKEIFAAVVTTAVLPYIRMMDSKVTLFLRKQFNDPTLKFEFDTDNLTFVESAFEQKSNSLKTLYSTGILSLNETREMLNLHKLDSEGADKHMIPSYLVGENFRYIEDGSQNNGGNNSTNNGNGSTDPQGGNADVPINPDNNSNNKP